MQRPGVSRKMVDPNTGDEIDFNYTSYSVSYKVPDYPTTYTNLSNNTTSNYDDGQDPIKARLNDSPLYSSRAANR